MDTQYLSETLGCELVDCLREVVLKRPPDPIEYIALWLLHRHGVNSVNAAEAREHEVMLEQKALRRQQKHRHCLLVKEELTLRDEAIQYQEDLILEKEREAEVEAAARAEALLAEEEEEEEDEDEEEDEEEEGESIRESSEGVQED